jgi:hypothetical protein
MPTISTVRIRSNSELTEGSIAKEFLVKRTEMRVISKLSENAQPVVVRSQESEVGRWIP